ncbi:MAG: glucose-6-phosphate dehydrogenase [Candidatus Levybacteria bacterium]|nr:glucose-6-phosphate dehydrogenase [Candidatus Levybacteria bacterium]
MSTPFVMIIYGATGDLTRSKLMSALFRLYQKGQLGDKFYIAGFARRPLSDEEFREMFADNLGVKSAKEWGEFSKNLYYQQGLFSEEEGFKQLIKKLKSFDQDLGACITRFFYLATPPSNYSEILENLQKTKLSEGCGQGSNKWTRIIIEKPFGKDLETAKALDKKLSEIFEERQIFRVDHYLGKETVQNIIAFRFANGIFEPVWNKNYIDHVQITLAETKGVGGRGKFYDGVGQLRDMAQNHLMQLVAGVSMEQPAHFSKDAVREARANAIKAVRRIEPDEVSKYVVRGQYNSYTDEPDVSKDSTTETFTALKLFVDTPRFSGVPFYLRTGKKMAKDEVSISIVFIQTCHLLFKEYGCPEIGNVLKIRIQPDEGISMRVIAKKPGAKLSLGTVDMEFSYKEEFGEEITDAYEKLLIDIFSGDQMLFNRSDELDSSWGFITKILKGWKSDESGIKNYESGTWGPKEAEELIEKDGRRWI